MAALQTHRMREITQNMKTASEKIRALDDAGFERADIARFLDTRYQHVRNVLVGPRPKATEQASLASGDAERPGHVLKGRIQIGAGGRVVIPSEMRAALGVTDGDTLQARVVDGELRLMSRETALRYAQNLVRQYIPEGVSLVDELIAERRDESAKDVAR
jgi:bifunctional DNA-binding transcriptional regulator/antitoxin component of YhaV-PrlF toxin-antitoxin module